MSADYPHALTNATKERSARTRQSINNALQRLDGDSRPLTVATLAHEAGVSRSWLYTQPDVLAWLRRRRAHQTSSPPTSATPQRQHASTDSLLVRLQAANQRLTALQAENQQLRDALSRALGANRDHTITHRRPPGDTPEKPSAEIIEPH